MNKLKDWYITAVDFVQDHPHAAFWAIVGLFVWKVIG